MELFLLLIDTIGAFGHVAAVMAAYWYGVKYLCLGFRRASEWTYSNVTRPVLLWPNAEGRA